LSIETLQTDGFIFMWAINSKIVPTIKLMDEWGYDVIDEI